MPEELYNLQYSLVRDYDYTYWFKPNDYNNKSLSASKKQEIIAIIDSAVADYAKGLSIMQDNLAVIKNQNGEFYEINRTVVSMFQFVLITMIDSMVATKYFLIAEKDYDRRFMRGKLMVILNEGFKKLYGFDVHTHKKSEWHRLSRLITHFPIAIQRQYDILTNLLKKHSQISTWWQDERNCEIHLDAESLYISRQQEIIESKVVMDSLTLFNTLYAVDLFLTNAHACIRNTLVTKYRRGELVE